MTIAEVSKKYDITADTLRYYERVGLLPSIGRTSGGIRNYSEEDCRWVEFTKCMRSAGIPIEALIEYVTLFQQGPKTRAARKQILIEQRDQLLAKMNDIQKSLDRLNEKIENYDANMAKTEAMLMMRKEH